MREQILIPVLFPLPLEFLLKVFVYFPTILTPKEHEELESFVSDFVLMEDHSLWLIGK